MSFINYFRKNKRDFLMKYTRDSDRFVRQIQTQKKLRLNRIFRAIDGARTRGLDLGKFARYQLRHYRIYYCQLFSSATKYIIQYKIYFVKCFFEKIKKQKGYRYCSEACISHCKKWRNLFFYFVDNHFR